MDTHESDWHALSTHLGVATGPANAVALPPTAFCALVASLIDPAAIRAAVPVYEGGPPTLWRVHAVSDTALAVAEIEFEAGAYTAEEERNQSRFSGANPSRFRITQAWVRPLNSIVEYSIDSLTFVTDATWCGVSARVRFASSTELYALPSQLRLYRDEDRSRSDELLRRVRDAANGSSSPARPKSS